MSSNARQPVSWRWDNLQGNLYYAVINTSPPGPEPALDKYVSLYIVLLGIFGGILLLVTVFLYCKYCRGNSTTVYLDAEREGRPFREEGRKRPGWSRRYDPSENLPGIPEGRVVDLEAEVKTRISTSPRMGEEHGKVSKHSGYPHGQGPSPSRGPDSPPSAFPHIVTERVECEVSVEIHTGPVISDDSNTSSSRSSPCESTVVHTSPHHQRYCTEPSSGVPSPLGVLPEWEAEELSLAPSTDWTALENSLEFWRKQHQRAPHDLDDDELEPFSKVRYNDTGSLEEVNVEHMIEYFVDDEISVASETDGKILQVNVERQVEYFVDDEISLASEIDGENLQVNMAHMVEYYVDDKSSLTTEMDGENLQLQYRQIWELRATLEEDEGLPDADLDSQMSRSSPDQSPELEAAASHTTSFESNTEPLLEEPGRWPPHLLQLPSYEARRQTYRNILSWRLRRLEARKQQAQAQTQAQGPPSKASQDDTSFDSIDTVDTEGSSTDASRLEQVTTSFESTTDNTDSTGEGQAHRLQQLRADSGYKSLENPPAPAPKLNRRQLPVSDSADLDALPTSMKPSTCASSLTSQDQDREGDSHELDISIKKCGLKVMSLVDSASCDIDTSANSTDIQHRRLALGDSSEPEHDEGVAEMQSPPLVEEHVWEGRRKSCGRSASKKRREFGSGRGAMALVSTDVEHHHHCRSIHCYPRDYSVDEKSDALFREFSRCDPAQSELLPRQRLGGSGYRRHQHAHHSRHSHYPSYPYPYPDPPRKFSEPRSSIDEEYSLSLSLQLNYPDDDAQLASVPIIRVADEDSSDHI